MDDDIRITNDTFRVIWAYGGRDPGEEEEVSWRDVDRAGGRLLHLYQGEVQEAREPSMKKWVVTSNQMILPEKVKIIIIIIIIIILIIMIIIMIKVIS